MVTPSVFFSLREKKPLRETIFWHFFHFFHVRKWFSRTLSSKIFTEGNGFHAQAQPFFSRIVLNFSRTKIREFSRKGYKFHGRGFLCFFFQCNKCNPWHFQPENFYGLKFVSRLLLRKIYMIVILFKGKVP